MTDPKPGTRATETLSIDFESATMVARQTILTTRPAGHSAQNLARAYLAREARIAADAVRLQAEMSRAHQYEAESEQKGADLMAAEGTIEDLSLQASTLREQVRTLREALKAALGHCDCSDYHGKALIPCTEAHPCAGCRTTRTGQAALAATEPKG